MDKREFLQFFIVGFLGGLIYKLLVYFSEPFDANWLGILLEITLIATIIAVVLMLFKRWGERGNQSK